MADRSRDETGGVTTSGDPWGVIRGLLETLTDSTSTSQSLMATVQAACDGIGADAAFWYSRGTGKISSPVGTHSVAENWCGLFAKALLERVPENSDVIVWNSPSTPKSGEPHSALMCRADRTQGCIIALSFRADRKFDESDAKVIRVAIRVLLNQRSQMQAGTKQLLLGLIQSLTTIMEAKDPYTAGHSERVARIASLISKQMKLSPAMQGDIYLAGLLHDIGKIGVRDEVLKNPGKLSVEEFDEIKQHPVVGEKIVASIKPFDRLRPAVRGHHERFDGDGYPDRLAGESIPILARVLALADACDAMMSPRRYRPGFSPIRIDEEFKLGTGKQFDPNVVAAFMDIREQVYPPIYQKGIGDSAYHAIDNIVENLTDASMIKLPVLAERDS